jgi:catechol 2,3-dioxygenase-like lactoylglutathione lyase family enzyme
MTAHRGFKVRALGEIAIRCDDLDAMANFYENIIGLDRLPGNASPDIVFFRIAEGFGGHTTVLALFDKRLASDGSAETPQTGARSALHHIALSLPYAEQEAVLRWYEAHGLTYHVENFGWVGWRGVFTQDPEGNTVELVAYDPDLLDP